MAWPVRKLLMPGGDVIVCLFCRTGAEPDLSLHDANHNVFRLNKDGDVVWQITRIDHPERNWEVAHRQAREEGQIGCIEPFLGFKVQYINGTVRGVNELPPDELDWEEGCTVELANLGFGTQWYSLDVKTGIAIEITPKGLKAW